MDNINNEPLGGINDVKSDSMNVDEVANVNLATYPSGKEAPSEKSHQEITQDSL